jgi:hypothetical protein
MLGVIKSIVGVLGESLEIESVLGVLGVIKSSVGVSKVGFHNRAGGARFYILLPSDFQKLYNRLLASGT